MTSSTAQRPIGYTATLALVAMTVCFAFSAPSSSTVSATASASHATHVTGR